MTTINIHGILGHEFKSVLKLSINKPKEIIEAISCRYPLFRYRINELSQQGVVYSILIDGDIPKSFEELSIKKTPKVIDIMPIICGQGPIGQTIAIFVAKTVVVAVIGAAISMALTPKPDLKRPEASVSAAKESFMIGSKANVTEQGIPVPVGYGRLRVGSVVIHSTVKSYPQNYNAVDALAGSFDNDIGIVTKGKQ